MNELCYWKIHLKNRITSVYKLQKNKKFLGWKSLVYQYSVSVNSSCYRWTSTLASAAFTKTPFLSLLGFPPSVFAKPHASLLLLLQLLYQSYTTEICQKCLFHQRMVEGKVDGIPSSRRTYITYSSKFN